MIAELLALDDFLYLLFERADVPDVAPATLREVAASIPHVVPALIVVSNDTLDDAAFGRFSTYKGLEPGGSLVFGAGPRERQGFFDRRPGAGRYLTSASPSLRTEYWNVICLSVG